MNINLAAIGVAKQTDKATPAANPTFYHGVTGGAMVAPEVSTSIVEVTTGLNGPAFAFRESAATAVGFDTIAFKKAIGLYLLGILGNVATTGASAPYTHVFTAGSAIPWLSFFSKLDAELRRATACKLDEVTIEWDGVKPLAIKIVGAGLTTGRVASITVPVADERLGAFFMPMGGSYQLDVNGSTLADYPVNKASISLKRGIAASYSCASIEPSDINESALVAEVELTAVVANLDDFWTIYTGASNGTAVSEAPIYGSFALGATDGTDELLIEGPKVAFSADPTEADPNGGPAELSLKGQLLIPAGETTPITVTLTNDVAAY